MKLESHFSNKHITLDEKLPLNVFCTLIFELFKYFLKSTISAKALEQKQENIYVKYSKASFFHFVLTLSVSSISSAILFSPSTRNNVQMGLTLRGISFKKRKGKKHSKLSFLKDLYIRTQLYLLIFLTHCIFTFLSMFRYCVCHLYFINL